MTPAPRRTYRRPHTVPMRLVFAKNHGSLPEVFLPLPDGRDVRIGAADLLGLIDQGVSLSFVLVTPRRPDGYGKGAYVQSRQRLSEGQGIRLVTPARLIMQNHIGRPLRPLEQVRYISGDALDLRFDNLLLFERKPKGERRKAKPTPATYKYRPPHDRRPSYNPSWWNS